VATRKKKNPSVPFGRRSLPSVPAFAPGLGRVLFGYFFCILSGAWRRMAHFSVLAAGQVDVKARCELYFRGLPRFAKINPRASAVQRSRLANLSASLRSRPGGICRASSKASAARISQSSLSGDRCVSLLIVGSIQLRRIVEILC
jgi:hypothetical protein